MMGLWYEMEIWKSYVESWMMTEWKEMILGFGFATCEFAMVSPFLDEGLCGRALLFLWCCPGLGNAVKEIMVGGVERRSRAEGEGTARNVVDLSRSQPTGSSITA
jgi:hypothetical protein